MFYCTRSTNIRKGKINFGYSNMKIIIVFQGLVLLACSGSEFIFWIFMNVLGSW